MRDESAASPKVLLAEDDALIRELVANYLSALGYFVEEAANGAEALSLLAATESEPYDLIVTDLLMPKASGEKVIEQARKTRACSRFLVMSGNPADPRNCPYARSEDACYLEKPFTFGDFSSKLRILQDRTRN